MTFRAAICRRGHGHTGACQHEPPDLGNHVELEDGTRVSPVQLLDGNVKVLSGAVRLGELQARLVPRTRSTCAPGPHQCQKRPL